MNCILIGKFNNEVNFYVCEKIQQNLWIWNSEKKITVEYRKAIFKQDQNVPVPLAFKFSQQVSKCIKYIQPRSKTIKCIYPNKSINYIQSASNILSQDRALDPDPHSFSRRGKFEGKNRKNARNMEDNFNFIIKKLTKCGQTSLFTV